MQQDNEQVTLWSRNQRTDRFRVHASLACTSLDACKVLEFDFSSGTDHDFLILQVTGFPRHENRLPVAEAADFPDREFNDAATVHVWLRIAREVW